MDTDVIVVGAGPTDLTTALELARRGVGVRVLDAAPAPFPGSRGKGLAPRTLELLDLAGVTDRLLSLGRTTLTIRHHGPDGTVRDVDRGAGAEPTGSTPWPSTLLLPQWRTEQVLRERLAEEDVTVEQDARVEDLVADGDGVTVVLGDRTLRAEYVVGADGGGSTVRRRLAVPFLGETREEVRMVVADLEIEGLDRDHWHQWGGADTFLGADSWVALCPLPASPTWQLQVAVTDDREPTDAVLRTVVESRGPRVRLRAVHWRSTWRLNVRMVSDYRVGRVLLAGDAAHVHSPAGAQGMNTGIGDAMNLGWKLAAVVGGADPGLLDTYAAERMPVAAGVLGLSGELSGRAVWTRSAGQIRNATQLDLSYRGGPLAPEGGDHAGPRPGDRAPDTPLGDGTLFLRRRATDWTVLAVDAPGPLLDGVTTIPVGAGDEAATIYAATAGELVALRPDGYVGWRGTDPDALAAWLRPLRPAAPVTAVAGTASHRGGSGRGGGPT